MKKLHKKALLIVCLFTLTTHLVGNSALQEPSLLPSGIKCMFKKIRREKLSDKEKKSLKTLQKRTFALTMVFGGLAGGSTFLFAMRKNIAQLFESTLQNTSTQTDNPSQKTPTANTSTQTEASDSDALKEEGPKNGLTTKSTSTQTEDSPEAKEKQESATELNALKQKALDLKQEHQQLQTYIKANLKSFTEEFQNLSSQINQKIKEKSENAQTTELNKLQNKIETLSQKNKALKKKNRKLLKEKHKATTENPDTTLNTNPQQSSQSVQPVAVIPPPPPPPLSLLPPKSKLDEKTLVSHNNKENGKQKNNADHMDELKNAVENRRQRLENNQSLPPKR